MKATSKSLAVVVLAVIAATSTAQAEGLSFKRTELGVSSQTYLFSGLSYSTSHYKVKAAVGVVNSPIEIEGRILYDNYLGLGVNQVHLTLGAVLSPNTKLGVSAGRYLPNGLPRIDQYALIGMHQFSNGDIVDLTAGQLRVSGVSLVTFAEAKYQHGSWFGELTHMALVGGFVNIAKVGYTHNLEHADISVSVGRLYATGLTPDTTKVSIELKIPLGRISDDTTKKSSQGNGGLSNRAFNDFSLIESVLN